MFDKTYVDAGNRGPSKINVHEHRAPTDDSVRLLGEMEQKALDRVIKAQPIECNGIKGSITHMFDPHVMGSVLYVSFAVGDSNRKDVRIELDTREMLEWNEYGRYLVSEVAIAIAQQLLPASDDVRRMIERRMR